MKNKTSTPFGAELLKDGRVRFRLWAPKAHTVELILGNGPARKLPLKRTENGWFELTSKDAHVGSHYKYQIDGKLKVPDPASRFQAQDVHGPSEVIDPHAFEWNDQCWKGRPWEEAVIYELHVGAFTREGTYRGVQDKLDYLRDLGVTAIELMPLADFPGNRNWGYDGVLPFAPDSSYGRPGDLKQLIQSAHSRGLMVFLDVVYNHFGPDGNYLHAYAPQFFTGRHHTPWGDAINYDGPGSQEVRDFFIQNAMYWLEEYHFDGLRLDAVNAIADDSTPNILTELAERVRERFRDQRFVHLILENDNNAPPFLRRDAEERAVLYDAQWNDDIHHALHVLLTGESDGYYSDYTHSPLQKLCRCLTEGFAYQGDYSQYRGENRGQPSHHLPLSAFISFLQNHDQIGNRAFGERVTQVARPEAVRAAMELLLLAPSPPLLFMGEEFGASSPFLFFCDFHGDLAAAVTNGRRNEFARFSKFSSPSVREQIPDPNAEQTFQRSKLDWESVNQECHAQWLQLYRSLLSIRQGAVVPHLSASGKAAILECDEKSRTLSIDWTFRDDAVLQLRANLGSQTATLSPSCSGTQIYPPLNEPGSLAPWSVVWWIRA